MKYPKPWEIHYKTGETCLHHSQYEVVMSLWEDDFSDDNIEKIVCEGVEYTVDDMVNNVILTHLKTPQDIVWAFDVLQEKAKELGYPIALNAITSEPICLYYHDDITDRVLVDKALSNGTFKCPKCKEDLSPSDVRGYRYVCHNCDENFFECEV